MTRIIAGSAGGRRIRVPSGTNTRPTSDRVREALFSSLESELGELSELRFLDLFAGSGAIGIEARSRGAGHVTMVEQGKNAAGLIRRNCDDLGLSGCEVVALPVERVLSVPPLAPYDIVFADPPYALSDEAVADLLDQVVANSWAGSGAVLVVERSSRGSSVQWPSAVTGIQVRKYGETALWYGLAISASSQ
jgi:16S rRNA (guanine966-N2)-methyltransferase